MLMSKKDENRVVQRNKKIGRVTLRALRSARNCHVGRTKLTTQYNPTSFKLIHVLSVMRERADIVQEQYLLFRSCRRPRNDSRAKRKCISMRGRAFVFRKITNAESANKIAACAVRLNDEVADR